MDIKKLSEKYKKAKAYEDGVKSDFWKYLSDELEAKARKTAEYAIAGGYETRDAEHDALVMARAYKILLIDIQTIANKAPKLKEQLEKIEVKAD